MNLWVKRIALGLLAAVALFLFACLDEDNILGFPNQNQKFKLTYVEIPLESSVLLFDSLRTSNHASDSTKRLLVGRYDDPIFGPASAEAYTQIRPSDASVAKPSTAVFDSVSLVLQFDLYHYGAKSRILETYSIHELTETLTHRFGNDYYSNTSVAYETAPLGEKSILLSAERLDSMKSKKDTLVTLSIPLVASYGERLFNAWNSSDNSFTDFQQFSKIFKGLAITGETNQEIVGFSVGLNSRVVLHYHTDKDTTSYNFPMSGVVSSSKVTVDRTGGALSGLTVPYEEYIPGDANKRYLQSGVPIGMKLNLAAFTEYFANFDKVLINSAELSISNIEAPGNFNPPNRLFIQMLDSRNHLKKFKLSDQDTTDMRLYSSPSFSITNGLQGILTSSISEDSIYTVMGDSQQDFASLQYNSSNKSYKGFLTLFMQELAQDEVDTQSNLTKTKFTDLILYPGYPHASKSLNRVSFDKNNMKLKIYYSTPIENE